MSTSRTTQTMQTSLRLGAALAWNKIRGGAAGSQAIEQAAASMGDLKGLAQKLGQTFSLILEELPPDAKSRMGKLFGETNPIPFEQVRSVIEADFGRPITALFADFSPTPLAAASLGQVHRAGLFDGASVAVKVQYPSMADAVESDLSKLASLSSLASVGAAGAEDVFHELRQSLRAELDYASELAALEKFRASLAPWPDVRVPTPYASHSSKHVLTTEFVDGTTLLHVEPDTRISLRLVKAVYGPLLCNGLLHGDVHPGNFLHTPEALVVLDFGCVREISPAFVSLLRLLCLNAQPSKIADAFDRAGFEFPSGRAGEEMREIIAEAFVPYARQSFDPAAPVAFRALSAVKRKYPLAATKLKIPPEAVILLRSVVLGLAATLKQLRAPFDARPFLQELATSS